MLKRGKILLNYLPEIILLTIAAWSIWPVIKNPSTSFFYAGDDALITWIINQTIQKIPDNLGEIFQGNIFYPYKNTLTYSNLHIPSALIGYIPAKLTNSHVAAYNWASIFAQFTTLFIIFFWFFEITRDKWSSLIATTAFALSKVRMFWMPHLHVFTMQWWLAAAWLLFRYSKNGRVWQLYIAGVFLSIQFWDSFYQVFWIILAGLIFLTPKTKLIKKHLKHFIFTLIIVVFLTFPAINAYFSVARQFNYFGSIREHAHFSMSLNYIWTRHLSPGLYAIFFISILIASKKSLSKNKYIKGFLVLLLISLVFSLGPVLKWQGETVKIFDKIFVPLPYSIFYYIIPGLSALRSVERWFWITTFASSAIMAIILSSIKIRLKYFIFPLVFVIAIVGGFNLNQTKEFPLPKDYPEVYSWLERKPAKVILEYPVYTWAHKHHKFEMYRMLYSLKHKKALINGASGFMPKEREELLGKIISGYPSNELNLTLINIGVDYVVVHKDEISALKNEEFKSDASFKEIWENESDTVYELR